MLYALSVPTQTLYQVHDAASIKSRKQFELSYPRGFTDCIQPFVCQANMAADSEGCCYWSLFSFLSFVADSGMGVVIMGVSGAGKSTIGEMLAKAVNCSFLDADDFHPQSNKEKMHKGIPLSDEDRIPWLNLLRDALRASLVSRKTMILGCSALQKQYREILRSADPNYVPGSYFSVMKFVLLDAGAEVLAARLEKRAGEGNHFMPAKLLQSQIDLLQIDESEGIVKVDATISPLVIVDTIKALFFDIYSHRGTSDESEGSTNSSAVKTRTRCPLQDQLLQRKISRDNVCNIVVATYLDRFIPNRSAMDFDYAHYMLTEGRKGKENPAVSSPSREAYRKQLAETFNMNRTRILAFKNKPPTPVEAIPHDFSGVQQSKPTKARRYIPQPQANMCLSYIKIEHPMGLTRLESGHGIVAFAIVVLNITSERTLDAPDLLDDYYLNLLDWGSSNVLAIALGSTVYLWDATDGATSELVTVDDENGPVTSVKWAPDGKHIAIGLNNSDVQLWDSTSNKQLRNLRGCHQSRVGSMDWNNHILTTGGMDGQIVNNDVRIRSHIVETYRGHHQEVCGLKWSASGQQLASGGNDNLLHIWDRSTASSNSPTQWLHRLEDHTAAVKALAWCPFQGNLLASGGGGGDRCIKFWNTHTGACLNSVDTGSQVCSLLWNKNERELLSSHGFTQNQLTLWKYPSMVKIAELTGHTSRVLFMAQSPDGCTVASAAGDETLRFWNVFGTPEVAKPAPKANPEPFAHLNRIR
ncbi:hypothetical protein RHSIM_Rhsim03G0220500 [Rhododendron simsii]|uniref:gluconokinase n=1 Tax=Rhododendron simsii TaxID=118357 RepID=A0A834H385_RHOSS|nr:hypothetical protein RHSIM_Rhsim03G0220500 [Rhododendron simsii]